jgi:hypothetical protein
MKKNILVYGLIAGVLVSTFMLASMNYISHCEGSINYNTSMLIGYASMIVAFSLVFVGIRNYRNNYNGGVITFGRAFGIGLMIVLIASTMYVAAWMVDYFVFMPDFMDKFALKAVEDLKASGAPQVEIDAKQTEMQELAKQYKQPFFFIMITYMEILPVGILVTIISSLILKRKNVQPSME